MEESILKERRFDSEQRDSEYFMWQSEDIDQDDPIESPSDKQSIYRFNSHPSLLVKNKGHTRRGEFRSSNMIASFPEFSIVDKSATMRYKSCCMETPKARFS